MHISGGMRSGDLDCCSFTRRPPAGKEEPADAYHLLLNVHLCARPRGPSESPCVGEKLVLAWPASAPLHRCRTCLRTAGTVKIVRLGTPSSPVHKRAHHDRRCCIRRQGTGCLRNSCTINPRSTGDARQGAGMHQESCGADAWGAQPNLKTLSLGLKANSAHQRVETQSCRPQSCAGTCATPQDLP